MVKFLVTGTMLTPKQQRFVAEYLIDLNATQAALKAGYSKRGIRVASSRLLADVNIQREIEDQLDARAARTGITQDKTLRELGRLGFSNMEDYAEWGDGYLKLRESADLTRAQKAAVIEVSCISVTVTKAGATETKSQVKIKLADKEGALDKIARHLRMYPKESGDININDAREVKLLVINADRDSD